MANNPSVLFMSCSDTQPDDIIKLMLEELPDKKVIDEDIHAYSWRIDNKYYTADVNLCSLKRKTISNKEFSDTVEATILYFDPTCNDALDRVNSWLPFITQHSPEIKILLCQNINNETTSCSKRSAQEWCIKNHFELVELEPIGDEEDDEIEDDFPETTGIKRIIQALNAHVWPNLAMKTHEKKANNVEKPKEDLNKLKEEFCFEESLEEMLEGDDDFSQLFSKLSDMRAKVMSMSGEDRKLAAEQVVMAFSKALGYDDDEILDL